ncbi:hypothetical protein LTR62_003570 [Meristemomyces frigidus]|uniref:P450 monooxygenase n=1 Tax=Meristemomyces frigidus TaxID=1508187 RepID=A0AAN7YGS0_9PEZI|nr:hypothetical protein LTR62_003570 [Meristemomyces frigidus]
MLTIYLGTAAAVLLALHYCILDPLFLGAKAKIPGPKLYALTKWRLAMDDFRGSRTRTIHKLHQQYGEVVRTGPNEVHFSSLDALQKIYGAGSGFERTDFYRMFDVYGRQNLFTFHSSKQHGDRKKLLANVYSKTSVSKGAIASMVEDRVNEYMSLLAGNTDKPVDMFKTLHYFSIDSITHFLYGPKTGGTSAVTGNHGHRALLDDILDPSRRRLSFFATHLPRFTKWLYSRAGSMEQLVRPFLPMQKPATYTGIRAHALQACHDARVAISDSSVSDSLEHTVIRELFQQAEKSRLQDLDIASECADHLLAGIDTTADTLMSLFWALSQPQYLHVQHRLTAEIRSVAPLPKNGGLVEASDKFVYLDAVIKETLRLYAPLPASEPRILNSDSIVAGYAIPRRTVVAMAPYTLHRNPEIFPDPLKFDPERWLVGDVQTRLRWFWAFSSGGRMCIGKHLAMAEMTSLVTAVYNKYSTAIATGFEGKAPAITSRVELFYDERAAQFEVIECNAELMVFPTADILGTGTLLPNSIHRAIFNLAVAVSTASVLNE